jgi:limonene-1,2-epoxide hydrolase
VFCVGVTEVTEVGAGVVERYLECLAAHDWDGLAATIADDGLVREGPFCDVIEGKAHYVAYLRKVCTSIKGHRLEVQRVSHADSHVSYAELTEAFEIDGVTKTWPECILFEQGDDGLIRHVSVFFKQRERDTS